MKIETFEVESVRYWNDIDGFFIISVGGDISIKGRAVVVPKGKIRVMYEKRYETRGWGDTIEAFKVFYENDEAATRTLLESGVIKGIKTAKALNVISTLGAAFWDILDLCVDKPFEMVEISGRSKLPVRHLERVNGIGHIVSAEIIASWRKVRPNFNVLKLAMLTGISLRQYNAAIQEIGAYKFEWSIINDPYSLTKINHFSWKDVDAIAKMELEGKQAIEHNSPSRLGAAVREAIRLQEAWGHIGGSYNKVMQDAHVLAEPDVDIALVLERFEDYDIVHIGDILTTRLNYEMEKKAAEKLLQVSRNSCKKIPISVNPQDFCEQEMDPKQKLAVLSCLYNGLTLVTGGPGTGKTSIVIATLLKIFRRYGVSFALCAPTGIAAIRMRKTSGEDAGTIHRTFNLAGETPYAPVVDYIIIDEASMDSTELQDRYLPLVNNQRLIYIGDPDQLPPVGKGFPLVEMIKAVPAVHLTHVFRQGEGSGIIAAAHQINSRHWPGAYDPDQQDFQIFYAEQKNMADMAIELAEKMRKEFGVTEILMLSPVRGKMDPKTRIPENDGGRYNINHKMKRHFNPINPNFEPLEFAVNDPVIQTKNDYKIEVMNGQIGIVKSINQAAIEHSTKMDILDAEEISVCKIQFDELTGMKEVSLPSATEMELAYCITIHKSQGNQADGVIVLLPPTYSGFYMKQLPFTAVTRAIKYSWVITPSKEIFMKYLVNNNTGERISLLSKFLTGTLQ